MNESSGSRASGRALERARRISRMLDDLIRIPGTRKRVGLDPLFGLVPGLGDWIPLLISLDLLVTAARFGAGPALLLRMLGHLVVDALVGTVPLLGDLFDLGWKANRRNLVLLERLMADPERTRRESRWVVGGVAAGAAAVVISGAVLSWWLITSVVGALFG